MKLIALSILSLFILIGCSDTDPVVVDSTELTSGNTNWSIELNFQTDSEISNAEMNEICSEFILLLEQSHQPYTIQYVKPGSIEGEAEPPGKSH